MPQLGFAKQSFLENHQRTPWVMTQEPQPAWPLFDRLFAQGRFTDLDYALTARLLRDIPSVNQEVAIFMCHLTLAAKEGHLCVRIHSDELNPSVSQLWQNEEDFLSLEEEQLLKELVIKGSQQIPSHLLTACSLKTETPYTPLCQEGQNFYLQRHWVYETLLLKNLKKHLESTPKLILDSQNINQAVQKLQEQKVLLEAQAQAVIEGCSNSFSMIIGGPGTGKTYTAGHLIRLFWQQLSFEQQQTCQIVLAAPTGKAAANLQRSLRKVADTTDFPKIQAKTLHALLGIKSQGRPSEVKRLTADLILIDESSMIDIRLMAYLFEALKPGCRLILLGDPYQLPSVEAGSVFADLIQLKQSHAHLKIPSTYLNVCLRAELSSLIEFAQLINQGKSQEVFNYLEQANRPEIKRLKLPETKKEAQKAFVNYIVNDFSITLKNVPSSLKLLQLFNQMRILSPMRKGPWGAETINELIWEKISQRTRHEEWVAVPIMISVNDYTQDLFNGETGVLVRRLPLTSLGLEDYALFPSRQSDEEVRKVSALLLPRYEYAYCLSVHKSQGSEFDRIILVLPEGAELFGREVLYTAVTRARQKIEIYGSDGVIEKTVKQQGIRLSGIETRFGKD